MDRGFTLVELLVVITIILVLAALSLAGFSKMRSYGYNTTNQPGRGTSGTA